MVRKNWIVIVCCVAVAAMLCAVAYGEKGEKECSLSAALQSAVKAIFPNGVIEKCKIEEASVKVTEATLKDNGKEAEVKLADDGMVVEVDATVDMNSLPAAVTQTIKSQNAEVKEIDKNIEYAQLKYVKLDTPKTYYEVDINKDGKKIEMEIAADGTILKQEVKEKKCDKEKDDNGKDEEHEGHDKD
jgi:hypothetical protein